MVFGRARRKHRTTGKSRLVYFVSHPIQYQAPLLRLLAGQDDIDLQVIFTDSADEERFDSGFGRRVEYDVPLLDGYAWQRFEWMKAARAVLSADLVWFHGWAGGRQQAMFVLALLARRPRAMRCETWEGGNSPTAPIRHRIRAIAHSAVLRSSSCVLAIGSRNRSYVMDAGVAGERVFSVPYAVDNHRFERDATGDAGIAAREWMGVPAGVPIVLFCGKLGTRKLPGLLLEAWRAADWGQAPVPDLVFVGDGPERAGLEDAANGDPRVKFPGFGNQSILPGVYATADVFVLASSAEPWGLAVNEAMASGTGVVVSDEVGCADDLVDGQTGEIVRTGIVEDLASALPRAVAEAERRGSTARRRVQEYSFEQDLAGIRDAFEYVRRDR